MTKKELDKLIDVIFQPSKDNEERIIHCTLSSLMRLTKLNKVEALNLIKEHGTLLEYEGWYEVTLGKKIIDVWTGENKA